MGTLGILYIIHKGLEPFVYQIKMNLFFPQKGTF